MSWMEICRRTKEKYRKTRWSGGETTELAIEPHDADFKDRTFSYRISSASFTGTESEFSDFTGYRQIILPLAGELRLFLTERCVQPHSLPGETRSRFVRDEVLNLPEQIRLRPYETFSFSGAQRIHAVNSPDCIDFNVIVREGREVRVEIIMPQEAKAPPRIDLPPGITILFSLQDFSFLTPFGCEQCSGWDLIKIHTATSSDWLLIENIEAPVILTHIAHTSALDS